MEISNLIKEAKPLYYERRRRQRRIQRTCLSVFMFFVILASGYGGYAIKTVNNAYVADADTTVSDSFIPMDEYGLITVAY